MLISSVSYVQTHENLRFVQDVFTILSQSKTQTMNTPSKKIAFLAIALVLIVAIVDYTVADMADVALCIRNCAQCKKMLGDYFEGSLCADSCVKFKGKMIPDCENIDSIAPFLNKLE